MGGGIYTKAAVVGEDLSDKNHYGLREDNYRNPVCIAGNVADNAGNIAGMGADLFGSLAEGAHAALGAGVVLARLEGLVVRADVAIAHLLYGHRGWDFDLVVAGRRLQGQGHARYGAGAEGHLGDQRSSHDSGSYHPLKCC